MPRKNTALHFSTGEHLHEEGDWTADLALTLLVSSDGAQILDAQHSSEARLCQSGPLPDGFECGRGHSPTDVVADDFTAAIGHESDGITIGAQSVFVGKFTVALGFGLREGYLAGDERFKLRFGNLFHLNSPVGSVGHRPAADDPYIGPLARISKHYFNGPSHFCGGKNKRGRR